MIEKAIICNPKRSSTANGHEGWYPYYAGYSSEFVLNLLTTSKIKSDSCILDPWNGSGTTTTVANALGYQTYGFDLNPVMVLAAKACLVKRKDITTLNPLSERIIKLADEEDFVHDNNDPLCIWFRPSSATYFRKIEKALQKSLVTDSTYKPLANSESLDHISDVAAFFYIALFRTLNHFVALFRPTNPTWIKLPSSLHNRRGPSAKTISQTFFNEIRLMLASVIVENVSDKRHQFSNISLASSCDIPACSESIDLIITSPPYCTRIDYAIVTMPELTLLGYHQNSSLDALRRNLIGTSTVPETTPIIRKQWGQTCNNFLDAVYNHSSKASQTYYFKNHAQYFDSIFKSITEIERVLAKNGVCALVVQDSNYKEIHNNLPLIFIEMAISVGLNLVREERFISKKNMAKRNPQVKKYRSSITASESVLCFRK